MKIALAGQGAFGTQHMKAIQNIPGIEVISLTGGRPAGTREFAETWKIPHWTTDLSETLKERGHRDPGSDSPGARDRHGHEHPASCAVGGNPHAVAVVQQRRTVRVVLPLHL